VLIVKIELTDEKDFGLLKINPFSASFIFRNPVVQLAFLQNLGKELKRRNRPVAKYPNKEVSA
jgi:hypothetical protein